MSKSILKVRDKEYELYEVLLRIKLSKESDGNFLTFDLFVDSQDSSRAGVAINSMTIPGTKANDIENATFELDENDDDTLNELRESVICEPGIVLELSHLKIIFGSFHDGLVDIRLEARCFKLDEGTSEVAEEGIPIVGIFSAKIQA